MTKCFNKISINARLHRIFIIAQFSFTLLESFILICFKHLSLSQVTQITPSEEKNKTETESLETNMRESAESF